MEQRPCDVDIGLIGRLTGFGDTTKTYATAADKRREAVVCGEGHPMAGLLKTSADAGQRGDVTVAAERGNDDICHHALRTIRLNIFTRSSE
ncbi:Uncharacterised protein [Mycobacteroides abscessus]|nr:Uncharacterised protein [Mycobacteroides abscessus]